MALPRSASFCVRRCRRGRRGAAAAAAVSLCCVEGEQAGRGGGSSLGVRSSPLGVERGGRDVHPPPPPYVCSGTHSPGAEASDGASEVGFGLPDRREGGGWGGGCWGKGAGSKRTFLRLMRLRRHSLSAPPTDAYPNTSKAVDAPPSLLRSLTYAASLNWGSFLGSAFCTTIGELR